MATKQKKQGGRRKGAGRKPIEDKKQQLTLYVRQSVIDSHGGTEAAKEVAYSALETSN